MKWGLHTEADMALAQVPFEKRLSRIVKNHRRMANGVVHSVNSNGLIVSRPKIYNPRFPLRGLLMLVATAFLFKGYIYATLGAVTYGDRVGDLASGTLIEQAGAWIMQADTATVAVATVLQSLGV